MEAFTSVCQLLVYVLDTDRHVLNCTLILAFPSEIAASYLWTKWCGHLTAFFYPWS